MTLKSSLPNHETLSPQENTYLEASMLFESQFGKESADILLSEFICAMDVILNDIDKEIEHQDPVTLKRLTHRIIGLCPMYQAKPSAELSQLIEDELQNENWDLIRGYNKRLRQSFDEYMGR